MNLFILNKLWTRWLDDPFSIKHMMLWFFLMVCICFYRVFWMLCTPFFGIMEDVEFLIFHLLNMLYVDEMPSTNSSLYQHFVCFHQRWVLSILFLIWMEFLWQHTLRWFKILSLWLNMKELPFHLALLFWSLNWGNSLKDVWHNSLCTYGL